MMRRVQILKVIFGLLLLMLLSLTGLFVYLKNMDFNSYKPLLSQWVLAETGRKLDIDGDVQLLFLWHPVLTVEGLHLANVRAGSRAHMINIQRMEVQLSLMRLLDGILEVDHVVLVAPDIVLETLPSGSSNWIFEPDPQLKLGADKQPDMESVLLPVPHIQRLLIRDAKVHYYDRRAKTDISLRLSHLELKQLPHATGFSMQGEGEVNHYAIQFAGVVDDLPHLLANQAIQLSGFQVDIAGVHGAVHGSIAQPLDAKGMALNIELKTDSVRQAASAVDVLLARDFPLNMQMLVKDDDKGFYLSKLRATVADDAIAGHVHVNLTGKRPAIDGVLHTTTFDLTRFLKSDQTQQKQADDKRLSLFADDNMDVTFLNKADVTLALQIKRLKLPEWELIDVDTQIHVKDAVLVLQPLSLGVAGGRLTGSISIASEPPVLRFSSSLHLSDMHPSALLKGLQAGDEKSEASLIKGTIINADIQLAGKGASVAEIMAHADGMLLVNLGKGRVQSKALRLIGGDVLMNLLNTVNPFSDKMSDNTLQCGVVHFRFKDGDMVTRKGIAFETGRMNIISSGHVNLATEKIDLSIRTETREGLGLNITNMVNVVKLGGTLMQPGVGIDVLKTGMLGARAVGAVATGGLSLLGESLLNRVMADSSPCATARNMAD